VHPPKTQLFDPEDRAQYDTKGVRREIETLREETWGLYVSRPVVARPNAWWIESWLLPELGVCLSDWRWRPGHERDQDMYVDIAALTREGRRIRMTDLYLDLVVRSGRGTEVVDVDEFVAAVAQGLLDPGTAEYALQRSHAVLDGLARHDHDHEAWLASLGVDLGPRAEPPAPADLTG
jgi:predicted RNA-binding protein associated with RNAse of E/G family